MHVHSNIIYISYGTVPYMKRHHMSKAARSKPSSLRRQALVVDQELWLERATRRWRWVDSC